MRNKNLVFQALCRECADESYLINRWAEIIENNPGTVEILEEVVSDKANFSKQLIDEIFLGFENGLQVSQVREYVVPGLNEAQIKVIRVAVEKGLTSEQIKIFAHPEFEFSQMLEIRTGLIQGLTKEQVKIYAKKDLSAMQMSEIRMALSRGIDSEQVSLFTDKQFNERQMNNILVGMLNVMNSRSNWTKEAVMLYARPEINEQKMNVIMRMIQERIPVDKIKNYVDAGFSEDQLCEIFKGFRNNLSQAEIDFYACKKYNYFQMCELRRSFESRIPIEEIRYYSCPKVESENMRAIVNCLQDGGSFVKIKKFLGNRIFEKKDGISDAEAEMQILRICYCISNKCFNDKVIEIIANGEYDSNCMKLLIEAIEDLKLDDEEINVIASSKIHDIEKINEMICGFVSGLTTEEVGSYANADYSANKMRIMRRFIKAGATSEEVNFFASDNYNEMQLESILMAFIKDGLTIEKIKSFVKPNMSYKKIDKIARNMYDEIKAKKLQVARDKLFSKIMNS